MGANMKKLFLILILLFSFAIFAEEEEEATGDISGSDLNPVVRGLNFKLAGGILAYVGKAGGSNAASPIGTAFKFNMGYDFNINDAMVIGAALSIGKLQYNVRPNDADGLDQNYKDSPWYEHYSPLSVGLDIDLTWLINPRWEFGAVIGFDYYAFGKTYKSGSTTKTNDGNIAVGGGLIFEYYTYTRRFSIGTSARFNYIIDFDGMSIMVTPFMKYSF